MEIHDKMPIEHTFRLANISGGMIVSVIADAAIFKHRDLGFVIHEKVTEGHTGAMAEDLILYFAPSRARVLLNAIRPILAAL
jgi:hypothetical protein